MDPLSPANQAIVDSWHLSLHAKRPRTVDLYLTEVRRFASWLNEAGLAGGDLLAVTKRDMEAWLGHLREQGRAQATMRSRWIVLRSFYGWAHTEQEITENPLERVKVEKARPPAPAVVTTEDMMLLLKACAGVDFYSRRDLAAIRMLAATGLRASELASLHEGDLDLRNRIASVRDGKGGRARVVRFDPETAAALDRYRRVRARHRCAALPELWIGHRGAVTRKGLQEILRKRSLLAGIGHVHPHQLRHTWADRWLAAGGTEGDLMRLGGWESSEMMRRYGESRAVDRALGAYDQIDPMGGL